MAMAHPVTVGMIHALRRASLPAAHAIAILDAVWRASSSSRVIAVPPLEQLQKNGL